MHTILKPKKVQNASQIHIRGGKNINKVFKYHYNIIVVPLGYLNEVKKLLKKDLIDGGREAACVFQLCLGEFRSSKRQ